MHAACSGHGLYIVVAPFHFPLFSTDLFGVPAKWSLMADEKTILATIQEKRH